MRVLMIMVKEYGGPKRPRRAARTLAKEGHEVFILARNRNNEKRMEYIDGATVIRLPYIRILGYRGNHYISLPLPINPVYVFYILYLIIKLQVDVIHVHDLPMVLPAIILARIFRITVIFDMHENYPAMAETWETKGILNAILIKLNLYRRLEKLCAEQSDYILVTCEEQYNRLVGIGVDPGKIWIIGNFPDLQVLNEWERDYEDILQSADEFILLYTGLLGYNRGLEDVIKGISILKDAIPNIKLLLVGDGEAKEALTDLVHHLGLEKHISFEGWIDYARFPEYIKRSDICVIPHPNNEHINTTIPNKLFEFMFLSKPLVVSDAAPLKRIVVDEAGAGLSFKSGDFRSFAKMVIYLYLDENLRVQMGKRGRNIILTKYNWERESQRLKQLYNKLMGNWAKNNHSCNQSCFI